MIAAHALTGGSARGAVLKLEVPLSFWGGVDLHDGTIVDRTHPRCGAPVAGRVLVMPGARGSSSSSSALVELARAGIAPAAILMLQHDPILVIGSLVAAELYGIEIPVLRLDPSAWEAIAEGDTIEIVADADGVIVTLAQ